MEFIELKNIINEIKDLRDRFSSTLDRVKHSFRIQFNLKHLD